MPLKPEGSDNYFDNIDHGLLEARIKSVITDAEIVRLIMLCVKMGVVTKGIKWEDVHPREAPDLPSDTSI